MKNTRPDIASLAEALETAAPRPRRPFPRDVAPDPGRTHDVDGNRLDGPQLLAAGLELEAREKDARIAEHERAEAERARGA